jgi:MFS family permease
MKASFLQAFNKDSSSKKRIILSLSFMMFIDSIGVGIILPILPDLFFSSHLSLVIGNPEHRIFLYSITLAAYPVMEFFGMSFFGRMSDKYGRKKLLLWGLSILIISYFLGMLSIQLHHFLLFLFARALSGFLAGMYSVGNALVSDISPTPEERFLNFRLPSLGNKLGMTVGPALSLFIVSNAYFSNSLAIPYFLATILASINFILLYHNLKKYPTTPAHSTKKLMSINWTQFFSTAVYVIRKRKTRFIVLAFFAFQFSMGLFSQALSLYLTIHFNYPPSKIGLFSAIMSLFLVSSIYGLIPWLHQYNCATQIKKALWVFFLLFLYIYVAIDLNIRLFPKSVIPVWLIYAHIFC